MVINVEDTDEEDAFVRSEQNFMHDRENFTVTRFTLWERFQTELNTLHLFVSLISIFLVCQFSFNAR